MNDEMLADRDSALAIPCEWCNADAGTPCVRPDDQELRNIAAHLPRLRGVGLAAPSVVGKGEPDPPVYRPSLVADSWAVEDVPLPNEPALDDDTPEAWL